MANNENSIRNNDTGSNCFLCYLCIHDGASMILGTIQLYWANVDELDATGISSNLEGLLSSLEGLIKEYCDDDIAKLKVEIQLLTLKGGTGFSSDGWGYDFEQIASRDVAYYDTIENVMGKLAQDIAEKFQERR
jgi:hypothetical protein